MVIVTCVLVLHQMTELTGWMERCFYDIASTSSPRTPSDRVAMIAIDGLGHFNQSHDVDGAVRSEPLLLNCHGRAIPSMALMTVLKSFNLDVADIRIDSVRSSLQLGKLRVATDGSAFVLPQFYTPKDGKPAFPVDSFLRSAGALAAATAEPATVPPNGTDLPDNVPAMNPQHFATIVSPANSLMVNEPTEVLARPPGSA